VCTKPLSNKQLGIQIWVEFRFFIQTPLRFEPNDNKKCHSSCFSLHPQNSPWFFEPWSYFISLFKIVDFLYQENSMEMRKSSRATLSPLRAHSSSIVFHQALTDLVISFEVCQATCWQCTLWTLSTNSFRPPTNT
jgi:hypothetical protein